MRTIPPSASGGGKRARGRARLLLAGLCALVVFPGAALALTGTLTPIGSPPACVAETDLGGLCTDGLGLLGPAAVAASPDGKFVYVASRTSNAVVVLRRDATTGALTQLGGKDGCVSATGTAGACTDGLGLDGPSGVAVSADGKSLYVVSRTSDSIAIFSRNLNTGVLGQLDGTAGCISDNGSAGKCVDAKALDSPLSVTVTPDGTSVYVASFNSNAVAAFKRNTTTGELTQLNGRGGCVRQAPSGTCEGGDGLTGPVAVAASPNNNSVYVASLLGDSVAAFSRNTTTGVLTQLPGGDGCISDTGASPCSDGVALDGPTSIALSDNGKSLYVAASQSDSVAAFSRNRTTGVLDQLRGTDACTSEDGTLGACADGVGLDGPFTVAAAGNNGVYVAANLSDSVAAFARNTTTGAIHQLSGTDACVSETGTAGLCADGVALDAPVGLAVAKGTSVYAASNLSNAVAAFARNTTTSRIAQLQTAIEGCISDTGSGGLCADGDRLTDPRAIAVSPDGKSAYAVAQGSNALLSFRRDPGTGELTALAGAAGCTTEDGSGGACVDGRGLTGPFAVTVSPDNKSVYVASLGGNAVAAFRRNTTTGVLTQLAGTAGCVSADGSGGECTPGVALGGPSAVVVSPNNNSVYVASALSDAVAIFQRNTTSGAITQPAGTAGCVSEDGSGGACADGVALDGADALALSPTGNNLYVASVNSDAVASFSRKATSGALTQLAGNDGCLNTTGLGCRNGDALDGPSGIAVARGGKNVYVASAISDAVSVIARDGATGALHPQDCISELGAGDCANARGLDGASGVVVSPDGKTVYVAAIVSDTIAVLGRDRATGAVQQLAGAAGCVSDDGTAGRCTDGRALDGPVAVAVNATGTSVYATTLGSDAIVGFVRQP